MIYIKSLTLSVVLGLMFIVDSRASASATNDPVKWFTEARYGIFYHWGLFTGGGSSTTGSKNLPYYKTVAGFEAAVGSPEFFAKNIVSLTKELGASYLTITMMHSCDKHMVIFPTRNPMFNYKTKGDYLGALIKEAHKKGLKIIGYFPAGPHHMKGANGTFYLNGIPDDWESDEANQIWEKQMYSFFAEIRERYGDNNLDGFWMDGFMSWKPVIESFPDALRIGNNQLSFGLNPPPHISTTEFLTGKLDPDYNRPSGLIKPNLLWGDDHLVPRKDRNEDIPTCNGWWYGGGKVDNKYTQDPTFLVKEMLCSLGVRREWNFTLGLGPLVDGNAPREFEPMITNMKRFMSWAKPAIYKTIGGEGAPIQGGWLNSGAFSVVMVDKKEPKTYYLCVTEPPTKWTKTELKLQHDWVDVASVTDLRTGAPVNYRVAGPIIIKVKDWGDIKSYGAKIFKIVLK